MNDLLGKGSVIILLGTGGVGKTTVAAALGIAAARSGLNTAVITVDPVPRLRDALGLERLGRSAQRLSSRRLKAAGLDPSLRLSAMMLDVKGAWDGLVERLASDPDRRRRIMSNPFYQNLTEHFAGSEAYAALQQLYDLHESGAFELEIVDTPPAAQAFDFLQAPARLARLLDSRVARWLFTPYASLGPAAMRLASRAAQFVARELERFAGATVLSSISDLFVAAADTVAQMVERLHKTEALLHSPAVRFILVTTVEEDRLRQAIQLVDEMGGAGLHLSGVVVNRFLDRPTLAELARNPEAEPPGLAEIPRLRQAASGPGGRLDPSLEALVDYLESYRERAKRELARVRKFAASLPPDVGLTIVPEIELGPRDLAAVATIAHYLTDRRAAIRVTAGGRDHRPQRRGKSP